MRNLTITRTKRLVASISKQRVYLEDYTSPEITINGIPCRKLGVLKNGDTQTFQIDNNEAKVFVIGDKLSKNFCNDFYQISAGEDNVYLSGKNCYNPATGNAFRFDGNDNEEAMANRKRGVKKGLLVLAFAFVVGIVLGCLKNCDALYIGDGDPKTFNVSGMSITLTDEFLKENMKGFTAAYASKDAVVFVLKEDFALAEGFESYSLKEYRNLLLEANMLNSTNVRNNENILGFKYERTVGDAEEPYTYYAYVYKTDDAFWLIQFAVESDLTDEYELKFDEWARSVTFNS